MESRQSSAHERFAESRGRADAMLGSEEIDVIPASLLDGATHQTPRGALVRAKKMGNSGEAAQIAGLRIFLASAGSDKQND